MAKYSTHAAPQTDPLPITTVAQIKFGQEIIINLQIVCPVQYDFPCPYSINGALYKQCSIKAIWHCLYDYSFQQHEHEQILHCWVILKRTHLHSSLSAAVSGRSTGSEVCTQERDSEREREREREGKRERERERERERVTNACKIQLSFS